MSNLILSLPLSQTLRHIAIYVAQRVYTILGRMCLTGFAFYIVVRCGFTYIMHVIITHVYIKQCVLRESWHSSLLVKIAKHKY